MQKGIYSSFLLSKKILCLLVDLVNLVCGGVTLQQTKSLWETSGNTTWNGETLFMLPVQQGQSRVESVKLRGITRTHVEPGKVWAGYESLRVCVCVRETLLKVQANPCD